MISPMTNRNRRKLADLITGLVPAFEIRPSRSNVEAMQNDREPGRFTRNPSPFRGLMLLRSAPSFFATAIVQGLFPLSPIPAPVRQPVSAQKTCTPLRNGLPPNKGQSHV